MHDKGLMESEIKANGIWFSLEKHRTLRAERRRELLKGIAFIVLITVVLLGLLWITP